MTYTVDDFKLKVQPGVFKQSEIVVMLGQNGTGKTSLIRMLAGKLKPDDEASIKEMPKFSISVKP